MINIYYICSLEQIRLFPSHSWLLHCYLEDSFTSVIYSCLNAYFHRGALFCSRTGPPGGGGEEGTLPSLNTVFLPKMVMGEAGSPHPSMLWWSQSESAHPHHSVRNSWLGTHERRMSTGIPPTSRWALNYFHLWITFSLGANFHLLVLPE